MYAIDDLSDAVDATEELLTPVDARFWGKLVVVAFFVSGAGFGLPTLPTSDGVSVQIDPAVEEAFGEAGIDVPTDALLSLVAFALVVVLVIWLALTILRAVMEFVLVDSLVSGEAHLRKSARRYAGRALSLFVFIVVTSVLLFAPVALVGYLAYADAGSIEALSLSTFAGLAAAGVVSGVVYTVVLRLTTALVVPIMYAADVGVLGGWRRLAGRIRSDPAEYVVYLVIATIVGFVASIFVTTIAAIAMIVVAIPFVLLAAASLLLGPLAIPVIVVLVVLFVLALFLVMGTINLPVVVYLRYYALLVLGDTDERYDLVPDRRRRVRAGDAWSESPGWDRERADAWDDGDESPSESDADAVVDDGDSERPSNGHGWDAGWASADDTETDEARNGADRENRSADHGWDAKDPSNDRADETAGDDEGTDADGWSYRDDDR